MATKRKSGEHSKAAKDKMKIDTRDNAMKYNAMQEVADAQALKKELEVKEAEGLKAMAHSSPPSGLVTVVRKRGRPAGSSSKKAIAPAPRQQGSHKLQTVLRYLLASPDNLDFVADLITRLK
jgi:hypothetical protein